MVDIHSCYNKAQDHDMGTKEKYVPCGIVDEDTGQLYVTFGSSYKTSDFMVDNLEEWWKSLSRTEKQRLDIIQIKVDNDQKIVEGEHNF